MRVVTWGVWITSSSKVWRMEPPTPIASSHWVGAAHAEVWRSPISYRSRTTTLAPESASSRATARPAKLAPQIRTSASPPNGVRSWPRLVRRVGTESEGTSSHSLYS